MMVSILSGINGLAWFTATGNHLACVIHWYCCVYIIEDNCRVFMFQGFPGLRPIFMPGSKKLSFISWYWTIRPSWVSIESFVMIELSGSWWFSFQCSLPVSLYVWYDCRPGILRCDFHHFDKADNFYFCYGPFCFVPRLSSLFVKPLF